MIRKRYIYLHNSRASLSDLKIKHTFKQNNVYSANSLLHQHGYQWILRIFASSMESVERLMVISTPILQVLGQDIVDFILQLKREQYALMIQRLRSIEVCKIIRDFYSTANLPHALFLADTYVPSESKMIPNLPRIFERDVASWDSLNLVAIGDHIK